jgi:hypothetical protein
MNIIYLGTWNALTLSKPGNLQELAEQIVNTQLETVTIRETIIHYTTVGLIKQARLGLALFIDMKNGTIF